MKKISIKLNGIVTRKKAEAIACQLIAEIHEQLDDFCAVEFIDETESVVLTPTCEEYGDEM